MLFPMWHSYCVAEIKSVTFILRLNISPQLKLHLLFQDKLFTLECQPFLSYESTHALKLKKMSNAPQTLTFHEYSVLGK